MACESMHVETPTLYCAVCCKFESKACKIETLFKSTSSFQKRLPECPKKSGQYLICMAAKRFLVVILKLNKLNNLYRGKNLGKYISDPQNVCEVKL